MKYLEEEELIPGTEYMTQLYSGLILTLVYKPLRGITWEGDDGIYTWHEVRYVFETKEEYLKKFT